MWFCLQEMLAAAMDALGLGHGGMGGWRGRIEPGNGWTDGGHGGMAAGSADGTSDLADSRNPHFLPTEPDASRGPLWSPFRLPPPTGGQGPVAASRMRKTASAAWGPSAGWSLRLPANSSATAAAMATLIPVRRAGSRASLRTGIRVPRI
jgi:hypothetical protein